MPSDHDTYLHKVASAPNRESDPLRDTVPTEIVPPPENVLQGELITTEDAPDEPEAEAQPEAEPEPEDEDGTGPEAGGEPEPTLLADGAATRETWMHLQASFVDNPRAAVTEGAALVADVLAQLEAAVRNQQLNGDTEALRLQMRRYRLLVDRLTGL